MGLSVSLFTDIRRSDDPEEDEGFLVTVPSEEWIYKTKNLEYEKYYTGKCDYGLVSYPYSRHLTFRSYLLDISGQHESLKVYNMGGWFKKEILWDNLDPTKPFYELIDFSDCEGCFDWEISEILLKDFKDYEERSKLEYDKEPHISHDHYHYECWIKLLERSVTEKGVVVFM